MRRKVGKRTLKRVPHKREEKYISRISRVVESDFRRNESEAD